MVIIVAVVVEKSSRTVASFVRESVKVGIVVSVVEESATVFDVGSVV